MSIVLLATDGKIGYTYGATPSNAASPIAAGFRVPPTGVTETRLGAARDLYQKCWGAIPTEIPLGNQVLQTGLSQTLA